MADELTYSDIVEEVATPETAPAAANVKVYINDGNDFLQMGLEDFEEAYNITDLRDRLKKGTGEGAVIEGKLSGLEANVASGDWSHVEGQNAVASGKDSHAENCGTTASGNYSHAEGWNSKATASNSHAEGTATTASGNSCHSEGYSTIASGNYCHAEGYKTKAMSNYSHAEGEETVSSGQATHAEGHKTKAFGVFSHAEGERTIAAKRDQHVFGKYNVEDNSSGTAGTYVEIVGNGSADDQRSNARTLDWQGNEALAGKLTVGAGPTEDKDVTTKEYVDGLTKAEKLGFAFATCPTAEATVAKVAACSNYTIAVNGFVAVKFDYAVPANATLNINSQGAHEIYHKGIAITAGIIEADDLALFVYDGSKYQLLGINRDFWDLSDRIAKGTGTRALIVGDVDHNIATKNMAYAEGVYTQAIGYQSHAEGGGTIASGDSSHSEGTSTIASGICSHAEGNTTTASGTSAHAEGYNTTASAFYSHAEGSSTTASDNCAHSEGANTEASGTCSHSEGANTKASGRYSHAEGQSTIAAKRGQHVSGRYNVEDTASGENGLYAEIIGNGTANDARSNARTLDWSGNEVLAGKLTLGANPTNDMDAATKKYVDDNTCTFDLSDRLAKGAGMKAIIEGDISNNIATGTNSHAEGQETKATQDNAHAEGDSTTASGYQSHAEGLGTVASNNNAHAEGRKTTASAGASHAEGNGTTASGLQSHAEGDYTTASGLNAHAEGEYTVAQRRNQHVFGRYNIPDTAGSYASDAGAYVEIVGNGGSLTRSNARTLDWSGNEVLAGKLTVGAGPTADMDVATKKYIDDIISALRTELGLT